MLPTVKRRCRLQYIDADLSDVCGQSFDHQTFRFSIYIFSMDDSSRVLQEGREIGSFKEDVLARGLLIVRYETFENS